MFIENTLTHDEALYYIDKCLLPSVKEKKNYFADMEDYMKDMLMLPHKDAIPAVCVLHPNGEEHWYSVEHMSKDVYIGSLVSIPYDNGVYVTEVRRVRYDAPHSLAYLEHEGVASVVLFRYRYDLIEGIDQIIKNKRQLICQKRFKRNQEAHYTDIAGVKRPVVLKRKTKGTFKKNTFYPFVEM